MTMKNWAYTYQDNGGTEQLGVVEASNERQALDRAYEEIDKVCVKGEMRKFYPVVIEGG